MPAIHYFPCTLSTSIKYTCKMSYCCVHQSPPSSPYYLLYSFIVDLAFTSGYISAILFCVFMKPEASKARYLLSPYVWLSSALSHQWKAQFTTSKTASIPPCLAATYQLRLIWAYFIYWESGGSKKMIRCKRRQWIAKLSIYLMKTYNATALQ